MYFFNQVWSAVFDHFACYPVISWTFVVLQFLQQRLVWFKFGPNSYCHLILIYYLTEGRSWQWSILLKTVKLLDLRKARVSFLSATRSVRIAEVDFLWVIYSDHASILHRCTELKFPTPRSLTWVSRIFQLAGVFCPLKYYLIHFTFLNFVGYT